MWLDYYMCVYKLACVHMRLLVCICSSTFPAQVVFPDFTCFRNAHKRRVMVCLLFTTRGRELTTNQPGLLGADPQAVQVLALFHFVVLG